MFSYIFKGKAHSDTSEDYMKDIGMTDEQIESVLAQKVFEESKPTQNPT